MIPITRSSRSASATIASAKTFVYCGGEPAAGGFSSRSIPSGESVSVTGTGFGAAAGSPLTIEFGFAACHSSIDSRPPSSAGAKPLPLTVWMWTTTGRSASKASRQRLAQGVHVVAVDHAHVGEVELLEEEARRPVGLDRRLDLRAEPLDPPAEPERQLGQPVLDPLAGVVEARVEADPVEVARERADVGRDRHPVVVEDDHDRRLQAAGGVQRLVGDAAGEGAVADHRGDLAVLADPLAHRLLQPDRVADRGRGVAGAHDVVLGLGDRAERGEAVVLADRRQPVAAAGEDLVRVGLVADVPEDLVARRVEQAVQGDGELAGAEVGAEVAADLADRVDDVGAHLLRDLLQLLVVEAVQVGGAVDPVEQRLVVWLVSSLWVGGFSLIRSS